MAATPEDAHRTLRERSLITLGVLRALNRPHELRIHLAAVASLRTRLEPELM
jgi:alkylhydroperoxidase/carboxymuconolactone decarboxylase family protein YurZ